MPRMHLFRGHDDKIIRSAVSCICLVEVNELYSRVATFVREETYTVF